MKNAASILFSDRIETDVFFPVFAVVPFCFDVVNWWQKIFKQIIPLTDRQLTGRRGPRLEFPLAGMTPSRLRSFRREEGS